MIRNLLIKLGLIAPKISGTERVTAVLDQFTDLIDELSEGTWSIADEIDENDAVIQSLVDQNIKLKATKDRAFEVRKNLKTLMGV